MERTISPVAAETTKARLRKPRRGGWLRIGEEIPRSTYTFIAALSFVLPLVLWCVLSYGKFISPLILPTPTKVIEGALRMAQSGALWSDTWISVTRIGLGFLFSAVLAIPLGILIGAYKGVEAAQEPLVGFIRYVPVPALTPLIMVVAGVDETAKILLIFIGTYFQMVIVVADVARQVPRDLISAGRTLGASRWQQLLYVLLPATLPGLMDTCRTMIGWAWTYLVIAEVVAANSGLGYRIMQGQRFLRTDQIFVGIFVLGLLGLATDLIFKFLQPRLLPWAEVARQ
jgi:NitT/TauT family transport system permease protein